MCDEAAAVATVEQLALLLSAGTLACGAEGLVGEADAGVVVVSHPDNAAAASSNPAGGSHWGFALPSSVEYQ